MRGWGRSSSRGASLATDRVEDVDQVSVRIAEQHRAVAPRLVRRLEDEPAHDRPEARALAVHVLYAKVDDEGALGRGGRGARGPCIQLALRRDRERIQGLGRPRVKARRLVLARRLPDDAERLAWGLPLRDSRELVGRRRDTRDHERVFGEDHHPTRLTSRTASKCASVLRTGRECSRANAAIQVSFTGMGVPASLRSCRIAA